MKRMNLIALGLALVALPAANRAQKPDTVKKVDSVKVDKAKADTGKKESTAEKIGRQTGSSLDKAAKTTQHNAKVLSKRTADNTTQAAQATGAEVSKSASKAASATKTNAKHLKADVKKATADTIHVPPKPDSAKKP